MGYDRTVFYGACIKVTCENEEAKNKVLHETHVDNLTQINGNWGEPKDSIYYLGPNNNAGKYGHFIDEYNEYGIVIDQNEMGNFLNNFKEDFKEEIEILKKAYDKCEIVVAVVNGGM